MERDPRDDDDLDRRYTEEDDRRYGRDSPNRSRDDRRSYNDTHDDLEDDDDLDDRDDRASDLDANEGMQYRTAENMKVHDPSAQPISFFYLGISGHIESGEFKDLDGLSIKFDFIAGDHWKLSKGNESGISQHSFKSQGMNKRIVWNFPFELSYASLNVSGWPQLVVYLSGKDIFGREVVEAYGTIHVPTQAGRHTRYLRTFTPMSSSVLTKFLGWATGKNAEYKEAP